MYKQEGEPKLYIISGFVDFRCGIYSLCSKILSIDPTIDLTSNSAFIFMCKRKDNIKILYWGGDGFWLLQHRLEESKYIWLNEENHINSITKKQLERLLDGLPMNPKSLHKEVKKRVLI